MISEWTFFQSVPLNLFFCGAPHLVHTHTTRTPRREEPMSVRGGGKRRMVREADMGASFGSCCRLSMGPPESTWGAYRWTACSEPCEYYPKSAINGRCNSVVTLPLLDKPRRIGLRHVGDEAARIVQREYLSESRSSSR